MKNKKGFTLIELLAVIAILAILMLLVTPNILSMFTSGRKEAFVTKVQSVWRAAEMDYVNNAFNTSSHELYCANDVKNRDSLTACSPIGIITDTPNYFVQMNTDGNLAKIVMSDDNFCYAGDKLNIDKNSDDLKEGKKILCNETTSGETKTINCTCE